MSMHTSATNALDDHMVASVRAVGMHHSITSASVHPAMDNYKSTTDLRVANHAARCL